MTNGTTKKYNIEIPEALEEMFRWNPAEAMKVYENLVEMHNKNN